MCNKYKNSVCIIVAVLVLALFTGCEVVKNDIPTGQNNEQSTVQNSGQATESGLIGNMYKEGLPIVKEKQTFKMYATKDVRCPAYNEMELFKDLEKQTNIHIEWEFEELNAGGQIKNLLIASGQYPDAFFMGINPEDISKYYDSKIFVPLNDYIEKYGTNIKKAFEQSPFYKQLCTYIDGNVYTLRQSGENEGHYNPDHMFIYKPWLDKLGLPVPSTVEELYNTLKAFKEEDPNENGKSDEIPFSFRNGSKIQGIHSLFAAFGRADLVESDINPPYSDHFVVENGKVVFTADKPEYRDAINYYHKFFAEGLFDQEGFTQDVKQYFAKGKTQEVTLGSFMLWNAENMAGTERAADYVPVPPLEGPGGKHWTNYMVTGGQLAGPAFAITSACKNPEILVRWVDQLYDKTMSLQMLNGKIGIVLEEGTTTTYDYAETPEGLSWDEFRYKYAPGYAPSAFFADDYGTVLPLPPATVPKVEIKHEIYDPYLDSETLPPLFFTQEETDWNRSVGLDIQNYVNTNRSKWLLEGGIDKEWDAYIEKLKELELEKHVQKMQTAYDRFVNN